MKISVVGINFWPEPTGNSPYTSQLAGFLSGIYDVSVITGIPHYPWWRRINFDDKDIPPSLARLQLIRVNHSVPTKSNLYGRLIMEITFGIRSIRRIPRQTNVLILVSPAMVSSALILAWVKIFQKETRVVTWVQDLYQVGMIETKSGGQFSRKIIEFLERKLLANSDALVFAHPGFEKNLRNQRFKLAKKTTSVPNWSQFDFSPSEAAQSVRSRLNWGDARVVLHIGNMGLKQGLDIVIKAAKEAESKSLDLIFCFVGGGNQLEKLKALTSASQNVQFLGTVSDSELSNLLSAADILLVHEAPGVREMSVPSKLTTYYQSGKPVLIASEPDSLSAQEIVTNQLGTWVKSGEPELLLETLLSVDLQALDKKAHKAITFVKERLSREVAMSKFKAFIDEVRK